MTRFVYVFGDPVPELRLESGAIVATLWCSNIYHLNAGPHSGPGSVRS